MLLLDAKIKNQCSSFDTIMKMEGDILRAMDGRKTKRIFLNATPYYIKQHTGIGYREIVKNLMQGKLPITSASNEWRALTILRDHGLAVPRVFGYGIKGLNPAYLKSFIILEAIEPAISLETLTENWLLQKPSFAFKKKLIETVAEMTAKMHACGVNHRDLYICHFLLKQNTSKAPGLPLYLIDLHRAQIRTSVPERWRIKDLAGLYFSSLHCGLTTRDRLRFIKSYTKRKLRQTLQEECGLWKKTYLRGERLRRDHE